MDRNWHWKRIFCFRHCGITDFDESYMMTLYRTVHSNWERTDPNVIMSPDNYVEKTSGRFFMPLLMKFCFNNAAKCTLIFWETANVSYYTMEWPTIIEVSQSFSHKQFDLSHCFSVYISLPVK